MFQASIHLQDENTYTRWNGSSKESEGINQTRLGTSRGMRYRASVNELLWFAQTMLGGYPSVGEKCSRKNIPRPSILWH